MSLTAGWIISHSPPLKEIHQVFRVDDLHSADSNTSELSFFFFGFPFFAQGGQIVKQDETKRDND